MTILFLSIEFNYCCGISRSIFPLMQGLRKHGYKVILGAPGGSMIGHLEEEGINFVPLPIYPEDKSPGQLWNGLRLIRKTVKQYHVDLIHSHHRLPEFLSRVVTLFGTTPTVATVHAILAGKKNLSFQSDKLIAVSRVVRDMLTEAFGIKKEKIHLVRNIPRKLRVPSPFEVQTFRERHGITATDFIVAGIGRLHSEKGFDLFLQAAKEFKKEKAIKVILVGKGTEKCSLQQYAKQQELPVIFIDEISDVELIYASADAIVVPSRQESAGLVAIEAASFRKPVVATSVGGLKETIRENTGIPVPPENADAIAHAVLRLFKEKALGELLGDGLFNYVTATYDPIQIVSQVVTIYQNLVADERNKMVTSYFKKRC